MSETIRDRIIRVAIILVFIFPFLVVMSWWITTDSKVRKVETRIKNAEMMIEQEEERAEEIKKLKAYYENEEYIQNVFHGSDTAHGSIQCTGKGDYVIR